MISIVTPAFNEEKNLVPLYERIWKTMEKTEYDWEWIIVDDHSRDKTFETITDLAAQDARVRGLRFSKNFGSHSACLCGIWNARGKAVITMTCDGQDPPELIIELLGQWEQGHQVVWAARNPTKNDSLLSRILSRSFYIIMRKFVGIRDIPKRGADFFLADRVVCDALSKNQEKNINLFALITWMGFRQKSIFYNRDVRLHGVSGWTFSKKIKLLIDSIIGFSYLPIRIMGGIGALVALIGLMYIPYLIINAFLGAPVEGWSELMIIILILGGIQMLMLAILGEYIWRTLEEARDRPIYLIEDATPPIAIDNK